MADTTRSRPGDHALDRELRSALEPPPAQVERIARRALSPADERRPTDRPVLAWGAAAAILALLLLPFLLEQDPGAVAPPPVPLATGNTAGGPSADGDPERATVRISNVDGPLTVSTDAGTRWIVLGDT